MKPTMSITELAANMLDVFHELETTGQELIVTEDGRPMLRITPIPPAPRPGLSVQELFGDVQGQVVFYEDINTPTIDEWSEV